MRFAFFEIFARNLEEMRSFSTWLEGDRLPRKVMLGTRLGDKEEDEEGNPTCDFAIYEFKRFATFVEIETMKASRDKRLAEYSKYKETHNAPF